MWATSRTPTITGTAANGTGDNATVTVEVLSGVTVTQTLTATRSGTTWSVAVPAALTEGAAYRPGRPRDGRRTGLQQRAARPGAGVEAHGDRS